MTVADATTLLVSDLHLDLARPHIVQLFEDYLASAEVRHANALYILGDLVEAWVGDDDDSELPERIAHATRAIHDAGIPVYFMVGNRDFLLGEAFASRAGFSLLPDAVVHDIGGTPTLLLHGDTLCTDDHAYQAIRAEVRTAPWQTRFLAQPLAARRAFAAKARDESRAHISHASDSIMDVNADTVIDVMRQHGVTRLVHGHTHRPARHLLEVDGRPAERIVLGDWYQHGSVLRVGRDTVELRGL